MSHVHISIAGGICPVCKNEMIDQIEWHSENQFVPREQCLRFYRHKKDKSFCMKDGTR